MMGPAMEMLAGRGRAGGPGADIAGQGRGPGRGFATPRLWASADISVDGRNLSNVVLTLQPAFSMAGRLEFHGATAQVPSDLTRVRVSLTPSDSSPNGRGTASAATGRVDETGRFTIDVVPGRYRLSAGNATGWSVESAVVGGQDALDFPLDIRSSQNLTGAVVTFTDQSDDGVGSCHEHAGAGRERLFAHHLPDGSAILASPVPPNPFGKACYGRHLLGQRPAARRLPGRACARPRAGIVVRRNLPPAAGRER